MVLKSLQGLKFVSKPVYTGTGVDPTRLLRTRFVRDLNTQIQLVQKPDMEGRRWWREVNGKCVVSLRYRNSPIALDNNGNTFFEVPNKDALLKTLKAIAKEVEAGGEWDALLDTK